MENKLIITPKTKVGELLDAYPSAEDLLIEIAPAFKKLRNPILSKTISKITSLEQAAAVGGVSLEVVINKLRSAVGLDNLENIQSSGSYSSEAPSWLKTVAVVKTFDTRPILAKGNHPIGEVMTLASKLNKGEALEVITPFLPAPMLDQIKAKGLQVWTEQVQPDLFKNYFANI